MRVQDGSFRLDRVIEKLATSDKVTLTIERLPEGKMRVTRQNARHVKQLGHERMLPRDQVLEIRWVSGRRHVARKERHHDEWDAPTAAYDPYGPGVEVLDEETTSDTSQ
jgi:hypothetical protein